MPNQQPQIEGQDKKRITWENVTNSNFMALQDPEYLRKKFNIPTLWEMVKTILLMHSALNQIPNS